MTSHDTTFKELVRALFLEFLQLFAPKLARQIKRGSVTFLDKELLRLGRGRYRRRIVDLVARVQLADQAGFVLVHIEHQAQRQADVRTRLFLYMAWLMEQYGLPVYPILLTSYDRPTKPEPDRYIVDVLGRRVLDFRFQVVQLNRLNWRRFARLKNPAAIALMAKMRIAPQDRPKVRVQILRMLAKLQLNRSKMDLIAGFVGTYLTLNAKEYFAFNRQLDKIEDRQEKERVMKVVDEVYRQAQLRARREGLEKGRQKGRQEGRQEGERASVERSLSAGFGHQFSAGLKQRIGELGVGEIQALAEALMNFNSVRDLERWLKDHDA